MPGEKHHDYIRHAPLPRLFGQVFAGAQLTLVRKQSDIGSAVKEGADARGGVAVFGRVGQEYGRP
jgi:hypothetical protein